MARPGRLGHEDNGFPPTLDARGDQIDSKQALNDQSDLAAGNAL